jgi:hypothetical protein
MSNEKLSDEDADRVTVDVVRAILKMDPLYAGQGKKPDAERFDMKDYGDRWREIHRESNARRR